MLCSRRLYSSRISCSSGVRRPGPEAGVWWGGVVDIVCCYVVVKVGGGGGGGGGALK